MKKYTGYGNGKKGNFSAKSFPGLELHPELLAASIKAANNAIAIKTWATYYVIKGHLKQCQRYTGVKFSFPMKDPEILTLMAYLMARVKLKAVTISTYLSGLRFLKIINRLNIKLLNLLTSGCGTSPGVFYPLT